MQDNSWLIPVVGSPEVAVRNPVDLQNLDLGDKLAVGSWERGLVVDIVPAAIEVAEEYSRLGYRNKADQVADS